MTKSFEGLSSVYRKVWGIMCVVGDGGDMRGIRRSCHLRSPTRHFRPQISGPIGTTWCLHFVSGWHGLWLSLRAIFLRVWVGNGIPN